MRVNAAPSSMTHTVSRFLVVENSRSSSGSAKIPSITVPMCPQEDAQRTGYEASSPPDKPCPRCVSFRWYDRFCIEGRLNVHFIPRWNMHNCKGIGIVLPHSCPYDVWESHLLFITHRQGFLKDYPIMRFPMSRDQALHSLGFFCAIKRVPSQAEHGGSWRSSGRSPDRGLRSSPGPLPALG
jgi:hypothetical protein